jgi:solute carrier family 25 (mitochondrial uncoupling protein), member 8/9
MEDASPCYLVCAFSAGFTAVIFGSPLDFCTTRHMNNPGVYKNPIDVMATTLRAEGPTAFYKGFVPNVARLGCFNMVLWLTLENIRAKFLAKNE